MSSSSAEPAVSTPPGLAGRTWTALLLLGFASGLPLFVSSRVVNAFLADAGVDAGTIGMLGLVALPYTLKPLWAPMVDGWRWWPGRRRGWLWATQVALILALFGLAAFGHTLAALATLVLCVATASATQDLAADAWRTETLSERQRGPGAALWVGAYRCGMLVAGGLALIVADRVGWSAAWMLLAVAMGLGLLGTALAPEPRAVRAPLGLRQAIVLPLVDLGQRYGRRLCAVLAFALLYKWGDALLDRQASVFLIQAGYTKTAIGGLQTGLGLVATLVGVGLGGLVQAWLGTARALLWLGLVQALSNLAYVWLAQQVEPDLAKLAIVVVVENGCGGLAMAAFLAWQMGYCTPGLAATQLALLTALMAAARDVLSAPSGYLVAPLGWPGFFFVSTLAALPALLLLPWVKPGPNAKEPGGDSDGADTGSGDGGSPLPPAPRALHGRDSRPESRA